MLSADNWKVKNALINPLPQCYAPQLRQTSGDRTKYFCPWIDCPTVVLGLDEFNTVARFLINFPFWMWGWLLDRCSETWQRSSCGEGEPALRVLRCPFQGGRWGWLGCVMAMSSLLCMREGVTLESSGMAVSRLLSSLRAYNHSSRVSQHSVLYLYTWLFFPLNTIWKLYSPMGAIFPPWMVQKPRAFFLALSPYHTRNGLESLV